MTEEQKQMTLGQVAEMKRNLEENIKNQLIDFMKQTGCQTLEINGWYQTSRNIGDNDVVEYKQEGNFNINMANLLNN